MMLEKEITRDIFTERYNDLIHGWLLCELKTKGSVKDMMHESLQIIYERTTHMVGRCQENQKT